MNDIRDKSCISYTDSFNGLSPSPDIMESIRPDPRPITGGPESSDQFLQNRVKPLHVAALVLAIAALISVLAACYVITRFAKFYYLVYRKVSRQESCMPLGKVSDLT